MHVKPRRALRPGNTGHHCACNGWQPLRRYATARAHFHHAAATGPCHRARVVTPRAFTSFTTTRQREERQAASNHALPTFTFSSLDFCGLPGRRAAGRRGLAGTAEGVRAYDRGQFALAAKELQPAAQAGDPRPNFTWG